MKLVELYYLLERFSDASGEVLDDIELLDIGINGDSILYVLAGCNGMQMTIEVPIGKEAVKND